MIQLPKWVLANPFPAIHDFESLTVIDQTARIYGAMTALIDEYNGFADAVNVQLAAFSEDETEARKEFELQITQVMNQFTCTMEQYLKINLESTAETIIWGSIEDGTIPLPTDATLSKESVPADASATGVRLAELQKLIAVERERISTLTANSESSTAENAELVDIRTAYDGTVHTTAGDAVREQGRIWNTAYPAIPVTWIDGKYIKGTTGELIANAELTATDFVDISAFAGMKIEVRCRIAATQGFAFYDESKSFISGVAGSSIGSCLTPYTVDVPSNAAYIRITGSLASYLPVLKESCFIRSALSVDDVHTKLIEYKQNRRPFARRIAMFGDSIMLGRDGDGDYTTITSNTIPKTVGRMLDMECDNFGVGSMGWIAKGSEMNAYQKISSVDLTGYDVITLCFGVNDHSETLGAWNSTDESTVMGQFNKCINYIYEHNHTARVIVIAPFNGRNVGSFPEYWYGQSWGNIDSLLKTACEHYWIPYISQKESPINAFTIQHLIGADGVHPSEEGYRRLGEWISGELRRLIG